MRPIEPHEWRLPAGDGAPSWSTLSDDARYALAQSLDAQRRARVELLRATEAALREGVTQEAIARELRLAPSAVRRLVAEVRAGLG